MSEPIPKFEYNLRKVTVATMAIDGLQTSSAGVYSLRRRMQSLPSTMNDLYLQRFGLLKDGSQKVLVTVLRWLICRGDRIELLPIADELAERYSLEESSNYGEPAFPSLRIVAKHLAEIGRDFFTVTKDAVQLDHNSVRDFIESIGQDGKAVINTCSSCGRTGPAGILAQAAGKEGKLIMAEYMLQTINSVKFQKDFILFKKRGNDSETDGSKKSPAPEALYLRYEVSDWYRHLRDAETAWAGQRSSKRWDSLYALAEQFLTPESKVYQDWLIRMNKRQEKVGKHDPPLYTAARYGLEGLIERYLSQGFDPSVKNRHQVSQHHLDVMRRCLTLNRVLHFTESA